MTTWNPADSAANITLSNGNLTAASAAANTVKLVRATTSKSSGKVYFELTVGATAGYSVIGFLTGSGSLTVDLSTTNQALCADSSGTVTMNAVAQANGVAFSTGNVIGFAIDFTARKFWMRKAGAGWPVGGWDPATNAGGWGPFTAGAYFPVLELYANGVSHTANFGATAFSYTVPSGFSAWDSANAQHLASDAQALAVSTALLDIQHHLGAAAQSLALASADIRVAHHLLAAAASLSTAAATLDVQKHLGAIAAAAAAASANLDVQTVGQSHLSAAAISRVATTAALDLQHHMTSAANAISNALAGIDVQHHIAAAAQSVSLATADLEALTHLQHLSAGAQAQSSASVDVRVTRTSGASAGNYLITNDAVIDFGYGRGRKSSPSRIRQKTRSEREAMN